VSVYLSYFTCLICLVASLSCISLMADNRHNLNEVFAQGEHWVTWKDPDDQFSFQYPSTWLFKPRENRFEDHDVELKVSGNMTTLSINVYTTTSVDLNGIAERAATPQAADTLIKLKLFEGPDFDTYSINGSRAGSLTWVADLPFIGKSVKQNIFSIVGNKFVGIVYTSSAADFDKYFPTVEKIIQSIRVNASAD
jgi:hypothetical protein